jgi:hypothetical protein
MRRVFDDTAAMTLWAALMLVGAAAGWVTVQPAWFIGAAGAGLVAEFIFATVRRRRRALN